MAKLGRRGLSQAANLNRAVLIESAAMPRPRARLDPAAMTRAFAPDGLHGATTEAIARCAGVAKPTVYAHGGSKAAVFLACVEAEVERLLSELSRADLQTRASPPRARLAALAAAIIDHGGAHPAAARLLHVTARHTASGVAGDVDAALARLPARLAAILRRDTTPACADRIAPALLGAASAIARSGAAGADPVADAAILGEAFTSVLEPAPDPDDADRVQSIGLY
jgi:AcrR family transcriptional regulator